MKKIVYILSAPLLVLLLCMLLSAVNSRAGASEVNEAMYTTSDQCMLDKVVPDTVSLSGNMPTLKVLKIRGSGLGFGTAVDVSFDGPGQEDAVTVLFSIALRKRLLVAVMVAADAAPGEYDITVTRPDGTACSGIALAVEGEDADPGQTTTTSVSGMPDTTCIPCGDFSFDCTISCNAEGCPVCLTISDSGMTMGFENGTYMVMEEGGWTLYDDTDSVCYSMSVDGLTSTLYGSNGKVCYTVASDESTGDVTIESSGKTYVIHKDGTWTCPDGSSWEMDPSCEEDDSAIVTSPTEGCQLFGLPPC